MVSRRDFLVTTGGLSTLPWLAQRIGPMPGLAGATAQAAPLAKAGGSKKTWQPPVQSPEDALTVPNGFSWDLIVKFGDRINKTGKKFGECADYLAFLPGTSDDQGFLWVNHEYIITHLLYGKMVQPNDKTKAMVDEEMTMIGGSYVEIIRDQKSKKWQLKPDSQAAFRVDAHTQIPMVGPAGGRTAMGTVSNCSGGVTPWGTILTCEENFENAWDPSDGDYFGWAKHYPVSLDDYGWVVEVDPTTQKSRKLTALGRFAHEGACLQIAKNKKVVVYMGDDARFQKLYKYVSNGFVTGDPKKDADLLNDGHLFVANMRTLHWEELSLRNQVLKNDPRFKSEKDILTNCRLAAEVAGGTPLSRPEGIVIDPRDGKVYLSLTNNDKAGDFFGSILVLSEKDGDHTGDAFNFDVYFSGNVASGLACPDNLAIGPDHSLWVTSDVSGSVVGKGIYAEIQRNGIYRLDRGADGVVRPHCFALAPQQAEFTGPCFHPNNKELFLSVQHPGEYSYVKTPGLTSHWPNAKGGTPASGVVVIQSDNLNWV